MSPLEILLTIVTEFPYALFGSIVAGLVIGYLGISVVARRIVFVGAALTQGAVAGMAFAHLPFVDVDPALGSLVFTLVLVLCSGARPSRRTVSSAQRSSWRSPCAF